jgi:general secretion pathway protein D
MNLRFREAALISLIVAVAFAQAPPPPPKPKSLPPGFGNPNGPATVPRPAPKPATPGATPAPGTPSQPPPNAQTPGQVPSAAPAAAGAPAGPATPPTVYGGLNLRGASLREVVDMLARQLKINYTIDSRVNGSVTLNTYGEVKDIDTRSLLDLVLRINNAAMVKVGDIYRIVPLGDLSRMPLPPETAKPGDIVSDESPMLNLVFLKYTTAEELAKVLEPFNGEGAKMIPYAPANLLFVLDSRRNLRRTMDLISLFDSDALANQRVRLFDVKNSRPSDLATDLDRVMRSISLNDKVASVKFLPVDRINTLIAVAQNPGVFETVEMWLTKLDVPLKSSGTAMDNYVYRLKYQRADCLAMVIQQLYGSMFYGLSGPVGMPSMGYGGGYAGGGFGGAYAGGFGSVNGFGGGGVYRSSYATVGGASAGLGIGAGCGGAMGGFGGIGYSSPYGMGAAYPYAGYAPQYVAPGSSSTNPLGGGTPVPMAAAPAAGQQPSDASGTYLGSNRPSEEAQMPRIVPNSLDNSLLIHATSTQYASILKLLHEMDVPPRQILLEAKIYEVTLGNGFSTGLTAQFLKNNPQGSQNGLLAGALNGGATSITIGTVVENSRLLLNYILTDNTSKTRLVQAPSLIATDSVPASITVGSEVPIVTSQGAGTVQNGGSSEVVQQIVQRSTGVTLNVLAHINPSGVVTLVVNQDISAPTASTEGAVAGQSFSTRNVQTQLTLQDGDTIAIGGIILESSDTSSAGIPGLHRLPILGAAFGTRSYSKQKTELIIFLTPRVIFDNAELQEASDELKARLRKLRHTITE